MDELRKGIAIGMLFGSGGEGHGNLMTKTATENGTYTAAEEIDPETGGIFDPPKDGYSIFTVDLPLDDKTVNITTSNIQSSVGGIFTYDPHDENPELEGYDYFTVNLSSVKDDIEDLQQQVSDLEDELEACHDCWEEVVAALQEYDPTYDPAEGECPADKVTEVVEHAKDCDDCKAEVVAKLQEYDPDFDPQTCQDIVDKIDEDEQAKEDAEEHEGYTFPSGVEVPDEVVTDLNTKLDDLDMPDTSMNYYAKIVLREQGSGTDIYQYKPLTAQLFTSEYTQYYSAGMLYTVNINGIEADICNTGFNLKSNNWRAEIDTWDRTTGTFTITVYISDPNYNPDVWHYWNTYTRTFSNIAGYGSADHTNKVTNRT